VASRPLPPFSTHRALPHLCWTARATAPPFVVRRCPRCDQSRTFTSARAFRVNAHRRRLDVWLLLHCDACSRTLRLPVLERTPVDCIDPDELAAYHRNDPARCDAVAAQHGLSVPWRVDGPGTPPPFVAGIALGAGVAVRLDRLIARALDRSRSAVVADLRAGRIQLDDPRSLRKPARHGQEVVVLE